MAAGVYGPLTTTAGVTSLQSSVQLSIDDGRQSLHGLVHIRIGDDQRRHQPHNVALAGRDDDQPRVARLLAHAARWLRVFARCPVS